MACVAVTGCINSIKAAGQFGEYPLPKAVQVEEFTTAAKADNSLVASSFRCLSPMATKCFNYCSPLHATQAAM